ncbi:MAG: N-6 DNA methylase [Bacteroidota bacterium]
MTTQEIVNKLWNLCNVLRDDGITYHQYVTELTYILFLKMAQETGKEDNIPEDYRWKVLVKLDGIQLKERYQAALLGLGKVGGIVQEIYQDASSNISEPANLNKIVKHIDQLDWFSARQDGLGELYEGLLEKNATEVKSGAGQYFTPRPLINVMVELMEPKLGERINDPAAGTFGFMISAHEYLKKHHDLFKLSDADYQFQIHDAISGCELVRDAHRLALMNAMLHGLESKLVLGDTLSNTGKTMKDFDLVLSNPPFGTKKGGERPTRDDLTIGSSNKQLNFLQHIYRSLKADGKTRAAVVLPDNVLFQDGDGQKVRADLMNKCDLHTILRLPTGIFYAQGVKTNVLFFTRGKTDKNNTHEVWIYDLRTNMPSFGKRTPLTAAHFAGFLAAYRAADRRSVQDERWSVLSREDIRRKGDNLDLGLIPDANLVNHDDLPEPKLLAEEAIGELEAMEADLEEVLRLLEVN